MTRFGFLLLGALLAMAAQAATRSAHFVAAADAAPAGTAVPETTPGKIPDGEGSGSSTEPLSRKLDRQGGVIHPPAAVDRGIAQDPPAIAPQSTPVIPPPGSAGGNPAAKPK